VTACCCPEKTLKKYVELVTQQDLKLAVREHEKAAHPTKTTRWVHLATDLMSQWQEATSAQNKQNRKSLKADRGRSTFAHQSPSAPNMTQTPTEPARKNPTEADPATYMSIRDGGAAAYAKSAIRHPAKDRKAQAKYGMENNSEKRRVTCIKAAWELTSGNATKQTFLLRWRKRNLKPTLTRT